MKEILCLIFDQVDDYELFTSPESLIEWLNKYNIRPADAFGKVIVHYKDNPRIAADFDIMPYAEEIEVDEKAVEEDAKAQWNIHLKYYQSLKDPLECLHSTYESIYEKEYQRQKYRFKEL